MKHPSNREFFAYWDDKRGGTRAPDRSEIEPAAVRELLGDIFVLSYDAAAGYPFRVAGTRVCALLGCDLKDRSFSALFAPGGRREIEQIIAVVAEEMQAAVAGITAINLRMVKQLGDLYGVPFQRDRSRAIIVGLIGGAVPTGLGVTTASTLAFAMPGPALVGLAVSAIAAGAMTRGIGLVFVEHFETGAMPLGAAEAVRA